jgi:hypothetical protein
MKGGIMVDPRRFLLVLLGCACLSACGAEPASDRSAGGSTASGQRLDPDKVPVDLRPLVPLAERWGIGDDVDRNAKVERASAAERQELRMALAPLQTRVTDWLNSFGQAEMPAEAAAFMYMQLAVEEMQGAP